MMRMSRKMEEVSPTRMILPDIECKNLGGLVLEYCSSSCAVGIVRAIFLSKSGVIRILL